MNFRFLLFLATLCFLTTNAFADVLMIKNGSVIDPQGQTVVRADVAVKQGKIISAHEILPTDAVKRIDATGKWILPGLIDMHVHAWGNPGLNGVNQAVGIDGSLKIFQQAGVTGVLDLFNSEEQLFDARRRQKAGELGGAQLYTSGSCLTLPGGHCSEMGIPTRTMSTPDEARREVKDLAKKNPDVMKIVYDHQFALPTINRDTLKAAIEESTRHGLKTIIHVGTWQDAREAVEAGATTITHLSCAELPDDLVDFFKQKGTSFIPTMTVLTDFYDLTNDKSFLDNPLLQSLTSEAIRQSYREQTSLDQRAKSFLDYQTRCRKFMKDSLRKLVAAKIPMMIGTDTGNFGTFMGYSVHRELEHFVEAGMTTWQALAAATTVSGEFLGKNIGVTEGSDADLLILKKSPLDNIKNSQSIEAVIQSGEVVFQSR
jgi:imidazolonepropionase-like amidohydrolase